jgi:hypothetical protein
MYGRSPFPAIGVLVALEPPREVELHPTHPPITMTTATQSRLAARFLISVSSRRSST